MENTPDGLASETNYLSEHKNSFVDKKAICQIFEMISGTVHVQFQVERGSSLNTKQNDCSFISLPGKRLSLLSVVFPFVCCSFLLQICVVVLKNWLFIFSF